MFKRFIIRTTASLFGTSLLLCAVATGLVATFGTPGPITRAFDQSDAYSALATSLGKQATDSQSDTAQALAQTSEVQSAINKALTPDVAKQATQQLITGTYHWLDGSTKQPDFNVDLRPAVQTFLQSAGDNAVTKAESMPICTLGQLQTLNVSSTNLDSLPCRPPGISAENIRQQTISQLQQGNKFLENPVLTADSLPKDSQGNTVFERLQAVPQIFNILHMLPWITALAAVILAGCIFLLQRDWRASGKTLSTHVVLGGVGLLILGLASMLLAAALRKQTVHAAGASATNASTDAIGGVIQVLANDMAHIFLWFAAGYLLIGIGVKIALRFLLPPAAPSSTTPDVTANTSARGISV